MAGEMLIAAFLRRIIIISLTNAGVPHFAHNKKQSHSNMIEVGVKQQDASKAGAMVQAQQFWDVGPEPLLRSSLRVDGSDGGKKRNIHDADLDTTVGSARLLAGARNPRIGLAKALGIHDR
jgi:hypothetical protein